MQLSYNAIKLAKHVSSYTGEKEVNDKGDETLSPRRLNGEESAQRRHFFKAIEAKEKATDTELQSLLSAHNDKVAEARKVLEAVKMDETPEQKDARILSGLNNNKDLVESLKNTIEKRNVLVAEKFEIELTDKTKSFLKKYFTEFGDKAGYSEGDDETVVELNTIL